MVAFRPRPPAARTGIHDRAVPHVEIQDVRTRSGQSIGGHSRQDQGGEGQGGDGKRSASSRRRGGQRETVGGQGHDPVGRQQQRPKRHAHAQQPSNKRRAVGGSIVERSGQEKG